MIPFFMAGVVHCKLSEVWLMAVITGFNGALGARHKIDYKTWQRIEQY